jgi:hypothetical protein
VALLTFDEHRRTVVSVGRTTTPRKPERAPQGEIPGGTEGDEFAGEADGEVAGRFPGIDRYNARTTGRPTHGKGELSAEGAAPRSADDFGRTGYSGSRRVWGHVSGS